MRRGWCRVRVVLAAVLALALLALPGPAMHGAMAMPVTAAGADHCDHAGTAPADEAPWDHKSLPTCCTAAPCAPSLDVLAPLAPSPPAILKEPPEATASARAAGLSLPPSVPPPRPAA